MSSLVELIFSALGTEQAAAAVKGVDASLTSMRETLASTAQAGVVSEASFQKVQTQLRATAKEAEAAGPKLAGVGRQIEALSLSLRDHLDGSLDGSTKQLLAMGAAAVSVHAIYAGLKSALSEGDDFRALSLRTGESVRNLVILDQAFRNAHMSQEQIARSSNLLDRALGGVNEMGGKTEGAFRRLGTSIELLKPLTYTEQLAVLTSGFAKLENAADRAAVAQQIFGRSGGQMLQLLGDPHAMEQAAKQAGAHADQIERDAEAFHQLEVRLNGVNTQLKMMWTGVLEQLLPGLESVAGVLEHLNMGGLTGILGAGGLMGGGGLVALMGVDALDRRLLNMQERFGAGLAGEISGVGAQFTGALAKFLPYGLAAAIAIEVTAGIMQGVNQAGIDKIYAESRRIQAEVTPFRQKRALVTTPDAASDIKAQIDAEVARLQAEAAPLEAKRDAEAARIARMPKGGGILNAFSYEQYPAGTDLSKLAFSEGDEAKLNELKSEITKLKGESQNFLGSATAVADTIARNQLAAVKASIAPLVAELSKLEKDNARLSLKSGTPAEQLDILQSRRAALEAERAALPKEGLTADERKAKNLEIENKLLEIKKEEMVVDAKLTEEAKKLATEENRRQVYALETKMETAKAAGNDELAETLREQIKLKRETFGLDGLDLDLVKQRIAAEHQIWVEQQAKKNARTQIEEERLALDNQLTALRENLSKLEGDYTRTDAEKWAERKKILEEEIADLRIAVKLEQDRAAAARARGDEHSALEHDKAAQGFSKQLVGVEGEQARMGPNPDSWVQQSKKSLAELRNSWGTTAQQIGHSISGTIGGALNSVSQNITGLLMQTESWSQAFARIGLAIETSIISAIVDMGVKYVATRIMMAFADKSIAASNVAAMIPIATATSAVWAAPAALATIASWGGAAAAAPGEVAMAMAATQGLALAETGGYFPGRDGEVAGIFHGNEFIFSAPAVRNIGASNLAAMHQAALRPAGSSAAMGAGGGGGGGGGRQSARNTHIYLDRSAWLDAVRSDMTGIAHEVYDQRSRS